MEQSLEAMRQRLQACIPQICSKSEADHIFVDKSLTWSWKWYFRLAAAMVASATEELREAKEEQAHVSQKDVGCEQWSWWRAKSEFDMVCRFCGSNTVPPDNR